MSDYLTYVLEQPNLVAHWAGGSSGGFLVDSTGGGRSLSLANASENQPSIVPSDDGASFALSGNYGSYASYLGNSSIFSAPSFTILAWVNAAKLVPNAYIASLHQQYAIQQYVPGVTDSYGWQETVIGWSGINEHDANVVTPGNLLYPNTTYMIGLWYGSLGAGNLLFPFLNGIGLRFGGAPIGTYGYRNFLFDLGAMDTGGGPTGPWFAGSMQHVSYFGAALNGGALQNLYALGVCTGAAQRWAIFQNGARPAVGTMTGLAFPWSVPLVPANAQRKTISITNIDDGIVWLAPGAGATVGKGRVLYPGETWSSSNFVGAVASVHSWGFGTKQLTVVET